MGNGINWKGQVFPRMANFTAHNRMTGVGNALKRHYLLYLLDYEQVPCPPYPPSRAAPRMLACSVEATAGARCAVVARL